MKEEVTGSITRKKENPGDELRKLAKELEEKGGGNGPHPLDCLSTREFLLVLYGYNLGTRNNSEIPLSQYLPYELKTILDNELVTSKP